MGSLEGHDQQVGAVETAFSAINSYSRAFEVGKVVRLMGAYDQEGQ